MSTAPQNVLCFARICGALKNIKRTGWVNNEIDLPESVADHMYRMTMLAFMIQDPTINKDHLIKICLVHDLAEAIVGDITPFDVNINAAQKQELEMVSSCPGRNASVLFCSDIYISAGGNYDYGTGRSAYDCPGDYW